MKRRYCGPCDDYTNANPCKVCGADTDLVCPACDREGATAGHDISGEHNHGEPERMHRDTDCLAEEWHRDGRGLWAMRVCHGSARHGGRHLFGAWRYNVGERPARTAAAK